jgi:hypothetical protein
MEWIDWLVSQLFDAGLSGRELQLCNTSEKVILGGHIEPVIVEREIARSSIAPVYGLRSTVCGHPFIIRMEPTVYKRRVEGGVLLVVVG